ncbi:MAG: alkaline phosphatase family protein, partial [Chloroflexota bacterium]
MLAASLIFGGLVVALLHSRSASSLAAQTSPASRVVVFVVDGLAPQWMTAANMPTVVNLSHNGTSYQQAWIGQLESTAAPSAASIGTGIFPGQNGVPGSEWQDASTRLVVHGTLPDQVLLGSLDQVMESKGV